MSKQVIPEPGREAPIRGDPWSWAFGRRHRRWAELAAPGVKAPGIPHQVHALSFQGCPQGGSLPTVSSALGGGRARTCRGQHPPEGVLLVPIGPEEGQVQSGHHTGLLASDLRLVEVDSL